jgi:hypothetical protein
MTLNEYQRLLTEFEPRAVREDAEHHRAVAEIERLQGMPSTAAVDEMIDLLATLVVAYEGRSWEEPADNYRVAALMVDDQLDPTLSFGRGEAGRENALAYTRAIRAGNKDKAVEIMRRCRASMPKQTVDSTELIREDRERE